MSEASPSGAQPTRAPVPTPRPEKPKEEAPSRIYLVSYPKIIFLYPTFLASLVAAIWLSFLGNPPVPTSTTAVAVNTVFMVILALNLVILAFDFPRTTSLTLFFCAAAIVMGLLLWFRINPDILPYLTGILIEFRPLANPTFYWRLPAFWE